MTDVVCGRLAVPPSDRHAAVAVAADGTPYLVVEGPAPDGAGRLFELVKLAPREAFTGKVDRYQCLVMRPAQGAEANGQCTCPDNTFRDRACKHVRTLFDLMKKGDL